MESRNFALILVLFAGVLSSCANAYYFPNGPPHRRFASGDPSNNSTFHPEPKQIVTDQPDPQEDSSMLMVNPVPKHFSGKSEAVPTLTMSARTVNQPLADEEPKPEPRTSTRVQIVPNRKYAKSGPQQKQASRCDQNYAFSQPGESVTLESPNYPREYPNNVKTSTCFSSPSGTTISTSCNDFNVESAASCRYDFFGLGLDGDPSTVVKYCGKGTLSSTSSTGNSLAIVFQSDRSNPGSTRNDPYRFRCTITVSDSSAGSTTTAGGGTTTVAPGDSGNCTCGQRNDGSRIVGGTDAKVNEFPWRCYMKTNSYSFFCGCTILSTGWVLTAAHCTAAVMPLPAGDTLYVVVGDHDRSRSNEAPSQQIAVESVHDHQQYNSDTMDNDVSLLKLRETLTLSTAISPICLPYRYANDEFQGETVVASGWGTTSQGGSVSNTLKKVDLPVLTTQECGQYYRGQITQNMICTYKPGKDTCQGDSGGSIDLFRNSRYYHIGVVSWGIGCAQNDRPGVYAKTTKFLNWIETTSGQTFCNA